MEWSRGTEVRVGLFVTIGLALFVVTLLVIGAERNQFEERVYYKVALSSANGVNRGTSVRMAGLGVGQVVRTTLPDDLAHKKVVVLLWVRSDMVSRIRRDSRIKIGTKGMLGDKQLEITPGSPGQPLLPPWSFIPPADRMGGTVLEVAESTLQDVQTTVSRVQEALAPLTEPGFGEDVRATAHEVREVARAVREGDGAAHKLLYDRETAAKLDTTLDALATMARDLRHATASVDAIAQEIQHGEGTAHALVYGTEGRDALVGLASASSELAALTRDIRQGDGLLHSLVYTQEQRNLISG